MVRPWKRRPGWRKIAPASKEIIQVSFVRAREKSQEQQNVAMPMPLNAFSRGVVPGGTGGPWLPQILADQSNLPLPRGGGRLCPPNNTGTPGFSDLPAALWLLMQQQAVGFFCMKTNGLWQFLLENMHKFCMKKLKVVSLFLSIWRNHWFVIHSSRPRYKFERKIKRSYWINLCRKFAKYIRKMYPNK